MKRYHPILIGLGIGVLILSLFLSQFIVNLHQPLSLFHNDWHFITFQLNHYMHVIQNGNWANLTTYPMYYGFSDSLFFGEFFPLHVLFAYPLYLFTNNIFFVSNLLVLLTIIFSYSTMFLLSWQSTKRMGASVIAGLIFAINPFMMGRFPDHLLVLSGGFLPLIFLLIERLLARPHRTGLGWLAVALTGQMLTSTIYYSIFLTVILPLYIGIRLFQKGWPEKSAIYNRGTIIGFIAFLSVISGIAYMYSKNNATLYSTRSQESTVAYSATVSDWLFTAPNNRLYGQLKPWAAKKYSYIVREGIYSEHNLATGVIPFILGLLGVWVLLYKKRDPLLIAFFTIGILSLVLSMGPQLTLSESVRLPGLYGLISTVNPLLGYLRVPTRIAVFSYLSFALVVAYGLSWLETRMKSKPYFILMVCITLGILGEYAIKPVEFLKQDKAVQQAYDAVNARSDINVILEYPIGNAIDYAYPQARMEELDAHYLAYALMYHNKKLFNGYSGFIPKEYQRRADLLSVNFPTRGKLTQLTQWGADALIIHKDEFTEKGRFESVVNSLQALGVSLMHTSDGIAVFDLTAWQADP